jgi:hypothetical protein
MKVYFVNPVALTHEVRVRAVAGDEPIRYGQECEVADELGRALLANGNWDTRAPEIPSPAYAAGKRRRNPAGYAGRGKES